MGLVFHGALLPYTHGQTYDAYIHMFFGNNYQMSWFDPWEPRWYTGFTVTAYPPGSHQSLGILMRFMDMRIAFIIMQLVAVIIVITGVYRFSRIWVNDTAAAYAAMLCAFSTSVSETIHIFGQLPTLLSIGCFLNAVPHIAGWIEHGKKTDLALGLIMTAATTAVHHVTPLFGTVFFIAPVGVAAWLSNLKRRQDTRPQTLIAGAIWASPALIRGVFIGTCMLTLIVTIVFPYWHWSITDPITQVSIPHGSRENFLAKPNLGLMFFVIPWGLLILAVPYVVKKSLQTALWPLGLSVMVALVLGTGGTTPIPKILLGPAFDILTLDRFTFWGSILILPFAGLGVQSLWDGRAGQILTSAFGAFMTRAALVLGLVCYVGLAISTAILPSIRPTQPDFIDPAPLVKFMDEDRHSDWRYLTLGFGDQFAYHSALINAESVDGNYHSARRLPSLMNYSVERLENSKYAGVPGLASLNQFLTNAEKFHLKYVFSNDEFYDPVLHYTGWNPITRLNNGIRVWEKPDISPLPDIRPRRDLPRYQKIMWGTLPIGALTLGFLTLIGLALRQKLISAPVQPVHNKAPSAHEDQVPARLIALTRIVPLILATIISIPLSASVYTNQKPLSPDAVIRAFYQHMDFRETDKAFALLAESPDLSYGQFLSIQKRTGGLLPSYGKLTAISFPDGTPETIERKSVSITTDLLYLTSVGTRAVQVTSKLETDKHGRWKLRYEPSKKAFSQALTLGENNRKLRDLASQVLQKPTDPIQRLARPDVEVMAAEFIEHDGRMYIAGRLKNLSEFPTCAKITARAGTNEAPNQLEQHSGRIGAHRLMPGQDMAFRIDFEGYLKIQDQAYNAAYDPEQFSVTELNSLPTNVSLDVSTTVCTPPHYNELAFSNIKMETTQNGSVLRAKISNTGTEIVSTLQIKLSHKTAQGQLIWVEPFYLQNNLIPGEERDLIIPLSNIRGKSVRPVTKLRINNVVQDVASTSIWPPAIQINREIDKYAQTRVTSQSEQIFMDYDAMIYHPID